MREITHLGEESAPLSGYFYDPERKRTTQKKLWSVTGCAQLESFLLAPWAARRRQDFLELLDRLSPSIDQLSAAIEQEEEKRSEVLHLMTHPGVGPLTALAFVLIVGTPERFPSGKQLGSSKGVK